MTEPSTSSTCSRCLRRGDHADRQAWSSVIVQRQLIGDAGGVDEGLALRRGARSTVANRCAIARPSASA
jgi:hypothetical protein